MSFLTRLGLNRDVLALSLARLGDAVGNSLLFVVMPLYIAQLPAPWLPLSEPLRAGIYISLFGIVNFFAQPVAAAVIDRFNRRKIFVLAGLLILAAATGAYVFAKVYWVVLVFRVVQSLGLAITLPPTLAILANVTESGTRGGSMGWFSTFRVSGIAVGPILGGLVHTTLGFDATFYFGAGFILLATVLVGVFVREVKAKVDEPRPFRLVDTSLLTPTLLALGFATLVMASSFAMISPLETQFNARLGQTSLLFGVAFSSLMVTRILVQIPLGRWSDRIGRRGLIVAGLLLMGVANAPMGLVTATWQFIALRVVQGIASGAIAAPAFALAADLAKAGGEGRQMSIVTMGFGLGIATGTLLAGLLGTVALWLPFVVAGGLNLVAAWTILHFAKEPARAQARAEAA